MRPLSIFLFIMATVTRAEAEGAYICDLTADGAFKRGDQIVLGISSGRLSWISAFGPGLSVKCITQGYILKCQEEPSQAYAFDTNTLVLFKETPRTWHHRGMALQATYAYPSLNYSSRP